MENGQLGAVRNTCSLASIWPRRQRRGERGTGALAGTRRQITALLQFGHDVSVVENCQSRLVAQVSCNSSFNLATTSASWRTLQPILKLRKSQKLQFGHDVSVVEN